MANGNNNFRRICTIVKCKDKFVAVNMLKFDKLLSLLKISFGMIVQDVITILNEYAPLPYAEDFDNTGLLVGDTSSVLTGVLVTLDTLETVVDEAIENNCNLIVSFHTIIFSGLKKLTGKTYVERTVQKAIKNKYLRFKRTNRHYRLQKYRKRGQTS